MATGLIDIIKRASIDANESGQPCDLRFGTVTSVNPLKVQITNQFTLPKSLLIVPEHLTDRKIQVTLNLETSSNGTHKHTYSGTETSANGSHTHELNGKKTITVHNALKKGDKVALIRKTGGQSYYILDRI
jgi:hypothetical protein